MIAPATYQGHGYYGFKQFAAAIIDSHSNVYGGRGADGQLYTAIYSSFITGSKNKDYANSERGYNSAAINRRQ